MKRIIATVLTAVVGLFGYTLVDTAIETRVSNLESRVAYLESVIDDYQKEPQIPAIPSTTRKTVTTTKKAVTTRPAPTTARPTEKYVVASGVCGKTTTWDLYSDGKLFVYGEGRMDGCTSEFDVPIAWDEYRAQIKEVEIEKGITFIGFGAFANCVNLEKVLIPDTVTEIGSFAFSRCNKLKSLNIPKNVNKLDAYAVSYCHSLESLVIPDSVTELGLSVFSACTSLKSITFGANITAFPDGAFHACGNLTDVYYKGTEEQWNAITVGEDNACLERATVHYNHEAN